MAYVSAIFSKVVINKLITHLQIEKININIPVYRGPPTSCDEYNQEFNYGNFEAS